MNKLNRNRPILSPTLKSMQYEEAPGELTVVGLNPFSCWMLAVPVWLSVPGAALKFELHDPLHAQFTTWPFAPVAFLPGQRGVSLAASCLFPGPS